MVDVDTSMHDGATVGASDIARLANVGRAAVSNWRRRFPDFPEPVGGSSASPLYSLADIEGWLGRHGRQFTVLPGDRVWQRVRGTVDDLRLGDVIGYVGAFLVFLSRDAKRWRTLARSDDHAIGEALTAAIVAAVPELPEGLPEPLDGEWVGIVRLVAKAAAAMGHRELFDFLCERYLGVQSRRLPVTPWPFAEVMVELGDAENSNVLDPACGVGTLLLAAQMRGARSLLGQEVNRTAARLCAARLLLHDRSVRVAAGDSLRRDALADERVDVVVCNPPFNERSWGYDELTSDPRWEYGLPPRGEPELAWVQHCLAHANPSGRVVIMMPTAAATRRSGRRIRGNLLRSGVLRAVISLPGSGPAASAAPDLWLLRKPCVDQPPPSHVLMVDATGDPSLAERAWRAFLADPQGPLPGPSRAVRIIDLLDDEVDLSPQHRLVGAVRPAETARFVPSRTDLLSATAALATNLPDLTVPSERETRPMTTVGELVKAGVVVIHQAPLKMTTDTGDTPTLTVNDIRHGRPPSGRATPGPGSVTVEPGDVVTMVASRHPVARVIDQGRCLLGPQLLLFRADPDRIDPYFLAGFLRAGQALGAARGSSLPPRTDPRRVPIPRLPLAEQRRYGEAFRRLAQFADHLAQTAAVGERLIRLGFTGLADGTLTPSSADEHS
ncbi:MAG TPA: N-6 DNA methylase [Kribbellaceae bacterium]|nr:N-6 DNA methylase [Kribbellaceae bacterium]